MDKIPSLIRIICGNRNGITNVDADQKELRSVIRFMDRRRIYGSNGRFRHGSEPRCTHCEVPTGFPGRHSDACRTGLHACPHASAGRLKKEKLAVRACGEIPTGLFRSLTIITMSNVCRVGKGERKKGGGLNRLPSSTVIFGYSYACPSSDCIFSQSSLKYHLYPPADL